MSGDDTVTRSGERISSGGTTTATREGEVEICIPRDLAIVLIGSDAGKEKRIRPHGAMTKGVALEQIVAVERFMKPFFEEEIDRVHNKRAGRPAANHVGKASAEEARALKAFCVRFVESVKQHLVKKGFDDRSYRSKQRLAQARALVNQINTALGLPSEDARSLADYAQEALGQALRLRDQLRELRSVCVRQAAPGATPAIVSTPAQELIEFFTPLNALVERIETTSRS